MRWPYLVMVTVVLVVLVMVLVVNFLLLVKVGELGGLYSCVELWWSDD